MDPITTAVLAALGQLAEPAVKGAYEAFKSLLVRKFGKPSDVVKAVETLEAKPDSAGRRETLAKEIASSGPARDSELQLAQALLEKSRSTSGGTLLRSGDRPKHGQAPVPQVDDYCFS